MQSLKEQIAELQYEIQQREAAIDVYRKQLKALEDSRVDCIHEFSKPLPNYEHEGGYCTHCGINELFAETLAFIKGKKLVKA